MAAHDDAGKSDQTDRFGESIRATCQSDPRMEKGKKNSLKFWADDPGHNNFPAHKSAPASDFRGHVCGYSPGFLIFAVSLRAILKRQG